MKSRGALIVVLLVAFATGGVFSCKSKDSVVPAVQRTPYVKLPASLAAQFSGEKAYVHVKTLSEMGPRPPASPGYEAALKYVEKELAGSGWTTRREEFTASTPKGPVKFVNLLARYASGSVDWNQSVSTVVCSHLDTKTMSYPFVGANDSGSSTGVLMEMARVLATDPAAASAVELVFFDGEESLIGDITKTDGLYGSKSYAYLLSHRTTRPALGVVLDIVGDSKYPMYYSRTTPAISAAAAAAAKEHAMDLQPAPTPITDDHEPLVEGGLTCFHVIGAFMSMPYWHHPGDTMENISPEALEKTGRTTLTTLSAQLP